MSGGIFQNNIRFRVNGILEKDEAILLVQLKSPVTGKLTWMPPGGGLEFGESMKAGLQREFQEETGLAIDPGHIAFINEFVRPPYHAIECYFWVQKSSGSLSLGTDPELTSDEQILRDLQWIPVKKLSELPVSPDSLPRLLQEGAEANPNTVLHTKM